MSERRYRPVRVRHVANCGGETVALADPAPVQEEALQGWNTYVLDFTPFEPMTLHRGDDVRLALVNVDTGERTRQFTGELDSIESTSEPWSLHLRAVGMLSRLRRVRTGGALDLSGMTDGEAVRAVLHYCEVPIANDDIQDAGYTLGQRKPVKWRNHESGLEMIQAIDEVFGAATIELGTGRVARVFYDLAPTGAVRRVFRAGDNADFFGLTRNRGGVEEIGNAWSVYGAEFKSRSNKGCLYTPYAKASTSLPRLGGGTVARQDFRSDIIQDKTLARQVARRLMRWHNREPDEIQIETLNDTRLTVGCVVGVRDGTYGISLGETKRYTVATIQRDGAFMVLGCIGGAAGAVGSIETGYDKTCNETVTEVEDLPPDILDPDPTGYGPEPWTAGPDPTFGGGPAIGPIDLPDYPLPDYTPWPLPSPAPAVPIETPGDDDDLTSDPPAACDPPCECAPSVPLTDGMTADASLGMRITGVFILGSSTPFEVGFTGADGEYKMVVDPAFTDRAAEISGPGGEPSSCGDAPIALDVETTFYLCWDAANRSLVGAVNHQEVLP